ncbi:serine/threonine protein kinase [Sandaracinus amylolyticus]|uniref:Serine/threonine protein kinase n=1 Tax=Sandaracinus amylolyticus TaxID=927083 RepID=A0A0F6SHH9_9BACT|nr:serine/threonine protein kinase [Sandaracinus amylolyticus]
MLPVVPQLPTRIGDLRVIARLGCGGMAEVFLARRTGIEGFDRRVVVKRMLPHLAHDQALSMAMLDEGRVLARLSHPNVVAVEEIGHDDSAYFLVMEYLRGASLSGVERELRAEGRGIEPAVAAHVVAEVAAGLHAAHELTDASGRWLELVHRDVTPHNVFLTLHGEVKLLDFGIAHFADRSSRTNTGVAKGKFAYMAPEQFEGAAPDRRVDVFALGVVLHEMLSGQRLFARTTEAEIVRAVVDQEVPRPSEVAPDARIPRALEDVCMRALARDPDERFQTAAAMRAVLRAELRSLDPSQDVRDRVAELARAYAADAGDRQAMVRETATLPEVPWTVRGADEAGSMPPRDVGSDRETARAPLRPTALQRVPWIVTGALVTAIAGTLATLSPAASIPTIASAPPRVPITIDSVPSGAQVRIDGSVRGETPLTFDASRATSAVSVRISRDGYVTSEAEVVPDRPVSLRLHLARAH